ncbi:MAG: hypothetical protein AMS16_06510 [Planctomycetes bacterium DG_58]|nr:MAG: hypothetical protein AMS16_06510 [Planctomycetes bacterium DG_58]
MVEESAGRGRMPRGLREEDPVVVMRHALERAEQRLPLFVGEDSEAQGALRALEERLGRLKTMGIEFSDVELSAYVRKLLPGNGRMTLVS